MGSALPADASTIEAQVRASRGLLVATTILGVCAVVADFALVLTGRSWGLFPRLLLATIVLLVYMHITARFGAGTLPGFRLPSGAEWKRWLLLLGAAGVLLAAASIVVHVWFGEAVPVARADVQWIVIYSCMVWPVYEEVIYRLALCAPTAALLGRTGAIIVNGLVFAGLHVAYGNPDPSNAIGGFALAWIFLRSRSLAVAILAHAVGNLAINFAPILYEHLR